MAIPIQIVLYSTDSALATRASEAAFARITQLNAVFSDYEPDSELTRLSNSSGGGKAIPISEDLWKVIGQAQQVSEWSDGAFDITVGPSVRVWRWARRHLEMPTKQRLKNAQELVGYRFIRMTPEQRSVELLRKGMKLDLGGIAKGYMISAAMDEIQRRGIRSALVRAGGDTRLGDPPPGRPGWKIAVAPLDTNTPPPVFLWLSRSAVATSGDTMQFVVLNGRRYSHVVDPRTGIGLTDHCSVTIVGPDSALTDALAKGVAVLGPDKGLKMIDRLPGYSAYVIRAPEGKIQTYQSARWRDVPKADPNAEAR